MNLGAVIMLSTSLLRNKQTEIRPGISFMSTVLCHIPHPPPSSLSSINSPTMIIKIGLNELEPARPVEVYHLFTQLCIFNVSVNLELPSVMAKWAGGGGEARRKDVGGEDRWDFYSLPTFAIRIRFKLADWFYRAFIQNGTVDNSHSFTYSSTFPLPSPFSSSSFFWLPFSRYVLGHPIPNFWGNFSCWMGKLKEPSPPQPSVCGRCLCQPL